MLKYLRGCEVDEACQVLSLGGRQVLLLLEPPLQLIDLKTNTPIRHFTENLLNNYFRTIFMTLIIFQNVNRHFRSGTGRFSRYKPPKNRMHA